MQAVGQRRARAAKYFVPDPSEPARLRAVPVGVGRAQLFITRPGRGRGYAAVSAPHPAGETFIGAVEPVPAPGALDGGRRLGPRIRQGVVALSHGTAILLALVRGRGEA